LSAWLSGRAADAGRGRGGSRYSELM